jgi:hypothetical protein
MMARGHADHVRVSIVARALKPSPSILSFHGLHGYAFLRHISAKQLVVGYSLPLTKKEPSQRPTHEQSDLVTIFPVYTYTK